MPSLCNQVTNRIPVIGFLDVDAFECQLWQQDNLETSSIPCVVANTSGKIVSVTNDAKWLGINRKDTPTVPQAMAKCPNLHVFTKPDKFGKQDQSKCRLGTWKIVTAIQSFLKEFNITDVILEVASSDEIYLDLSAQVSREMERVSQAGGNPGVTENLITVPDNIVWERQRQMKQGPLKFRRPVQPITSKIGMARGNKFYMYKDQERIMFGGLFMNLLCSHVEKWTGLKSSAGVAKNKLMAKVGCCLHKPGKITLLGEEAFGRVASIVKISSIPGLGGKIGQTLMETFDVDRVSEIFTIGFHQLEKKFGKDMAKKIYSWGKGQCNDPVVAKISKDQIRVNKPEGNICYLSELESTLRNLIGEIEEILSEEKSRYFRTTDTLCVEFKLSGQPKGFRQNFRISDEDKFDKILNVIVPERKFIHVLGEGNVVKTLSFVLKNFEPCCNGGSVDTLKAYPSLQSLPIGVPNTLKVTTKCPPTDLNLTFTHSTVGMFKMTKDLEFSMVDNHTSPRLLPLKELQSLLEYNLLKKFDPATEPTVISDYTFYDERKHSCFSQWLREEGSQLSRPEGLQFIAFQGRIYRALKTLANLTFGSWDTHAVHVNGTIYLWEETTGSQTFNYKRQFMAGLFVNLTTGKGKSGVPEDAIEKVFVVQKVHFGTHTLLLLNTVDAEESSGSYVQTTLAADPAGYKNHKNNESFVLERNLKLWGQAVVSGAPRVVIGTRNKKNKLTGVDVVETDTFRKSFMKDDEMGQCFNFQNRLLTFIKDHLPESNPKLVKKFSWCPANPNNVTVTTVPQEEVDNLLIPKIYLKYIIYQNLY